MVPEAKSLLANGVGPLRVRGSLGSGWGALSLSGALRFGRGRRGPFFFVQQLQGAFTKLRLCEAELLQPAKQRDQLRAQVVFRVGRLDAEALAGPAAQTRMPVDGQPGQRA